MKNTKTINAETAMIPDGTKVEVNYYGHVATGTIESHRCLAVRPFCVEYSVKLDKPANIFGAVRDDLLVGESGYHRYADHHINRVIADPDTHVVAVDQIEKNRSRYIFCTIPAWAKLAEVDFRGDVKKWRRA